jgi:hypothetical protein
MDDVQKNVSLYTWHVQQHVDYECFVEYNLNTAQETNLPMGHFLHTQQNDT